MAVNDLHIVGDIVAVMVVTVVSAADEHYDDYDYDGDDGDGGGCGCIGEDMVDLGQGDNRFESIR